MEMLQVLALILAGGALLFAAMFPLFLLAHEASKPRPPIRSQPAEA